MPGELFRSGRGDDLNLCGLLRTSDHCADEKTKGRRSKKDVLHDGEK